MFTSVDGLVRQNSRRDSSRLLLESAEQERLVDGRIHSLEKKSMGMPSLKLSEAKMAQVRCFRRTARSSAPCATAHTRPVALCSGQPLLLCQACVTAVYRQRGLRSGLYRAPWRRL